MNAWQRLPAWVAGAFVVAAVSPAARVGDIGAALSQPSIPLAAISEDLRLDAERYDFPSVSRIFVGPTEQIVVPITQDMQLRIYDAGGVLRATLGRRGAGPGEFQSVNHVGWKADSMWVDDVVQHRVTWFGPDFRFIRTSAYPQIPRTLSSPTGQSIRGVFAYGIVGVRRDGALIGDAVTMGGAADTADAQRAWGTARWLVVIGPGSEGRALVPLPWSGDQRWAMSVGGYGRPLPLAIMPQVVGDGRGLRTAHLTSYATSRSAGEYAVAVFGPEGDTLFARTYPYSATPIPQSVRDSVLGALFPTGKRFAEGNPAAFAALARERMPTFYPGARSITLGLDKTTWIELQPSERSGHYRVLNAVGDPIARVEVPLGSRVVQASRSRIWAVETDRDGVASVVRYRVDGIRCSAGACD